MTMKLFHGTAATNLPRILKHGIRPRQESPSNWDKAPSREDMVYLTVAYPLYFAFSEHGKQAAVIEIDPSLLDVDLLYPDEDYVAQAIQGDKRTGFKAVHRKVRKSLERFQIFWEQSLMKLGNVCYRGIVPPEAITRYCTFDTAKRPELTLDILDPVISVTNFAMMGRSYQEFVQWMFGDRNLHPNVAEVRGYPADYPQKKEMLAFWKKESKDRTGIEVVKVRR